MQVSHSTNHEPAREPAASQVFAAQFCYRFMITWHSSQLVKGYKTEFLKTTAGCSFTIN